MPPKCHIHFCYLVGVGDTSAMVCPECEAAKRAVSPVERVARALCRERIRNNLKNDPKPRPPEFIQRAEDASWEIFRRDAEIAVATIQQSQ